MRRREFYMGTTESLINREFDEDLLDSGTWTQFQDDFAGDGKTKFFKYEFIIVEGREAKARDLFQEITNLDPNNVTCNCCGKHFMVKEFNSVYQATAPYRGCSYDSELEEFLEILAVNSTVNRHISLEEFLAKDSVLLVYADGKTNKLIRR